MASNIIARIQITREQELRHSTLKTSIHGQPRVTRKSKASDLGNQKKIAKKQTLSPLVHKRGGLERKKMAERKKKAQVQLPKKQKEKQQLIRKSQRKKVLILLVRQMSQQVLLKENRRQKLELPNKIPKKKLRMIVCQRNQQ